MKNIQVRASIKLASIEDIYCGAKTYEGKILFLKCPFTQKFEGIYRVPKIEDISLQDMLPQEVKEWISSTNTYHRKEILVGLTRNQFYTFSNTNSVYDYQFKLILKQAEEFDFFITPKDIRPNIIYYQKINDHEISGPLTTNTFSEIIHIKSAINNGLMYIISSNQKFEPIKIAAAS